MIALNKLLSQIKPIKISTLSMWFLVELSSQEFLIKGILLKKTTKQLGKKQQHNNRLKEQTHSKSKSYDSKEEFEPRK